MSFSFQKFLSFLGVCILVAIVVSALTYRASETSSQVDLDFPDTLVLQMRDETKTSTLTLVITQAGKLWFEIPSDLVIVDAPIRRTAADLAGGILTDAVRSNFSTLLQHDEVDVWQLDANALAALVEVVDGYELDGRTLDGNETIAELRIGEPGDAARFAKMWRYVAANLDAGQLTEVLANLGSTSRSNRSIEDLVSYFGSMQATFQSNSISLREVKCIEGSVNGTIGLYLKEKSRLAILRSIEEGRT